MKKIVCLVFIIIIFVAANILAKCEKEAIFNLLDAKKVFLTGERNEIKKMVLECRGNEYDGAWLGYSFDVEIKLRLLGICFHPQGMTDDDNCFLGEVHAAENESLFDKYCKYNPAAADLCARFSESMEEGEANFPAPISPAE
ncbi:MAG: hypothetical protein ABIA04_13070 [Pseudomonadota bacterium]